MKITTVESNKKYFVVVEANDNDMSLPLHFRLCKQQVENRHNYRWDTEDNY